MEAFLCDLALLQVSETTKITSGIINVEQPKVGDVFERAIEDIPRPPTGEKRPDLRIYAVPKAIGFEFVRLNGQEIFKDTTFEVITNRQFQGFWVSETALAFLEDVRPLLVSVADSMDGAWEKTDGNWLWFTISPTDKKVSFEKNSEILTVDLSTGKTVESEPERSEVVSVVEKSEK